MSSEVVGVVVPGVPAGWELVEFRRAVRGEMSIGANGNPYLIESEQTIGVTAIIRPAAPVCEWPRGVFAEGWLVQDGDELMYLYLTRKPSFSHGSDEWVVQKCNPEEYAVIEKSLFAKPPAFRSDAPFEKRIQRVGPVFEAGLLVEGGGQ